MKLDAKTVAKLALPDGKRDAIYSTMTCRGSA